MNLTRKNFQQWLESLYPIQVCGVGGVANANPLAVYMSKNSPNTWYVYPSSYNKDAAGTARVYTDTYDVQWQLELPQWAIEFGLIVNREYNVLPISARQALQILESMGG